MRFLSCGLKERLQKMICRARLRLEKPSKLPNGDLVRLCLCDMRVGTRQYGLCISMCMPLGYS